MLGPALVGDAVGEHAGPMLLADWRNGSFAILLAVGVLLVGYALATRNQMPAAEGPMFREGADPSAAVRTAVPLDRITE
jgi:hypothetical protein